MLNTSPDFLLGRPLALRIAASERRAFRERLASLSERKRIQDWEVLLQPRQGTAFPASLTVAVVRDPEGQPVTLRWLMQDISERKESERLREEAVLQERHRIAQELHDTLAQGFAGIAVQLEAAKAVRNDSPGAAEGHIVQAQTLARESLAEARRSVQALRSPLLVESDLRQAFRLLAAEVCQRTGVEAEFHCSGSLRTLPASLKNDLLRIGQEASTNTVRHARAQHLCFELRFEPEQLVLRISDDGCGFLPESAAAQGGSGLKGMRERARRQGGHLRLVSASGQGTVVEATIPLASPQKFAGGRHA
jgi:signal transduction histidine kinase